MEYNLIADFLAKFANFTPWIQFAITITIGFIFISLFYFLKQLITDFIWMLTARSIYKKLTLTLQNLLY